MNRDLDRRRSLWRLASFAVAAGFIALWQMIANLKLVSPVFLPGPDRAWAALVRGFSDGDLWSKLVGTLEHMAYGWLAASHRRHRDRRDDRLVAARCGPTSRRAGVSAAAAGLGDHPGGDRHASA